MFLRKASKFITGTPQDSIIPVPTFICAQCGKVNEEFSLKNNPDNSYNRILTTDGVHLNAKGNALVAEEMWKALQ
jgi:lysophospholipase L1-like esterase